MIRSVAFPQTVSVNVFARSRNNFAVRYLLAAAEAIGVARISVGIARSGDSVSYFGFSVMIIRVKFAVLNAANFADGFCVAIRFSSAVGGFVEFNSAIRAGMPMIGSVAFPFAVGVDVIIRISFPVLNAADFANSSAGASRLASAVGG